MDRRIFSRMMFTFLLSLWGCAHPISSEQKSDSLSLATVAQNPGAYLGSEVLWGGMILDIQSLPQGTELTILQAPLGREGPDLSVTHGEFTAKTTISLDPDLYQQGSRITLKGILVGEETRLSGPMKHTYPVVSIREIQLWKIGESPFRPFRSSGLDWTNYSRFTWPFEWEDTRIQSSGRMQVP